VVLEPSHCRGRVDDRGLESEHHKFVAAQSRDDVCIAEGRAQDIGDIGERAIALRVTEIIVDPFSPSRSPKYNTPTGPDGVPSSTGTPPAQKSRGGCAGR